jgi:transposase
MFHTETKQTMYVLKMYVPHLNKIYYDWKIHTLPWKKTYSDGKKDSVLKQKRLWLKIIYYDKIIFHMKNEISGIY